MPDPRSLRFGFGLGICVFAVLLVWLAWPAQESPGPRMEVPEAEGKAAPVAAEGARSRDRIAEGASSNPEQLKSEVFSQRGIQEKALIQIVDGQKAAPLAGLDIAARSSYGYSATFRTDADGYLELHHSLLVGTWRLTLAEAASAFDSLQPERVWLEPGTMTIVQLMRPDATLQIEVRGPTGLAVAGATIDLARRAEGRTHDYRRFWSDEQGRLAIPWPPTGTSTAGWRATAFHAEEGSCAPVDLPDAEQPEPTVLQLEAGMRLELQVTDSVHAPIPFLEVRLRSHALTQHAFVAQLSGSVDYLDQHGARVWTQLPAGEYALSLRSPVGAGWLQRSVTLGTQSERIDWVVDQPQQAIALAGTLYDGELELFPAVHEFVEVRDGVSDELIAGTRTDAAGRFRLFGEASGEVVLYTGLLDSDLAFPPHVHRFPAGKRDVVLSGIKQSIDEVVFRVTDRASGAPIANARLLRSDSDLGVLAGVSDSRGILVGRVIRRHSYVLKADGYSPVAMTGSGADALSSIELSRAEND